MENLGWKIHMKFAIMIFGAIWEFVDGERFQGEIKNLSDCW